MYSAQKEQIGVGRNVWYRFTGLSSEKMLLLDQCIEFPSITALLWASLGISYCIPWCASGGSSVFHRV